MTEWNTGCLCAEAKNRKKKYKDFELQETGMVIGTSVRPRRAEWGIYNNDGNCIISGEAHLSLYQAKGFIDNYLIEDGVDN